MMTDGTWSLGDKPLTREALTASTIECMRVENAMATPAQLEAIVDYWDAHECAALHAISKILGTCCHCVACLNEPPRPPD